MAFSSPGVARGRLLASALRTGIRRLLQSREAVRLIRFLQALSLPRPDEFQDLTRQPVIVRIDRIHFRHVAVLRQHHGAGAPGWPLAGCLPEQIELPHKMGKSSSELTAINGMSVFKRPASDD